LGKYNYKAEQLAFRLSLIAKLSSVLSVFRIIFVLRTGFSHVEMKAYNTGVDNIKT